MNRKLSDPMELFAARRFSNGLLAACLLMMTPAAPQSITVTLTSSVTKQGSVYLAVYDNDRGFTTRQEVISLVRPTNGDPLYLEVDLPAAGEYVLAAFHDLNGNGKLDTNIFGAPTEPYGFGKQAPSKWREPLFSEIATAVAGAGTEVRIELKKWKEY